MSEAVPEGWSVDKLSELTTKFQNGYAFSAKGYVEEGIPIISMGGIGLDGQYNKNYSKQKYWLSNTRDKLARYIVNPEDLIMAMTDVTPTMELIGRACIVKSNRESYLNQRVGLISVDETKLSKYFLAHYTNYDLWRSYSIGSSGLGAQANIGTAQILDGNVLTPPLPEQQKIASILTSVDEVIEKTEAHISKLQDLKKGMMQELLTNGIGHTEFKDSPVGSIPKGWDVGRFDSFCVLQRGFDLPAQDRKAGEHPVIGSNGIVGFHYEQRVNGPCVVTGRSGSIGQVMYFKKGVWPLNTSLYIKEFHNNHEKFVYYFLQLFDLSRYGTGTGVPTLNRNDVHMVTIAYPKYEEQKYISNILTSVDKRLTKNSEKLNGLKSIKKAIMQDLLTGKVRVKTD